MDSSAVRTQVPVAGERWRELTLQANAQHAARDYRGALRLYNAALGEAEAVLERELRQPDSQRIIGPLHSAEERASDVIERARTVLHVVDEAENASTH